MPASTPTVGDLARTVVSTTSPTTTLREVAAELTGENCGVLLVMRSQALIGIVSERDVTRAIGEGEDPDQLRVEDVMTDEVLTVRRDATLHEALSLMDQNQVRHLVITDGTSPTGVLSQRDLAHAMVTTTQPA